jgi:uncharacterized UBP type Zn finger protein
MSLNYYPANLKNKSGLYELIAVLSHRGRSADSGHYVAWIKEGESNELITFRVSHLVFHKTNGSISMIPM